MENVPIEAVPGVPDADDVSDPVVPATVLAPLPVDPFQDVKDDIRSFMKAQELTWAALEKRLSTLSMAEAGALQHLTEALASLKDGAVVLGAPYAAQFLAKSPSGFMVQMAIQRQDGAVFLDAVAKLDAWLLQAGYTPQA